MAQLLKTKSIYYRDVNLIAQPAKIRSRKEIPIEGHRIVVSAMSSIVGTEFIKAVGALPKELQPTIHIPRTKNVAELLEAASNAELEHILVGVGINTPEIAELAAGYGFQDVLLDVANGYLPNVIEAVEKYTKQGFHVTVGSVHTEEGYKGLADAGAFTVRSGIAPGSVCITKEMTGFTRGTLTEILELNKAKQNYKSGTGSAEILADGGFKYPSDVIKAFGAGADYIMTGRLFVNAEEAQLRVTTDPNRKDIYYGMASHLGKEDMGRPIEHIEGRLDPLPRNDLKPLKEILEDVWQAIRSGVSYGGASTLTEFIGTGTFELMQDVSNR